MLSINLIPVVLAALASFVLGFLFHGPVSGKLWMKLADIHPTGNEKFSDMVPQLIYNLLSNLVTAYFLAVIYLYVSTSDISSGPGVYTGIMTGLLVWIGFLATSSSIEVIWMGRKSSLWLFECACSFIVMIAMGAIVGSF